MFFRISPGVPFGDDVRRIAYELIDGAVADSGARSIPYPERVHSIRKRCKKLRALVRLVRPGLVDTYRQENEGAFNQSSQHHGLSLESGRDGCGDENGGGT